MINKTKETEHQIQFALVEYIKLKHPGVLFWATPNGGLRNKATAAKLKKEGALSGVPDLFIAEPRSYWSGLFVELKAEKGRVSKNQEKILRMLNDRRFLAIWCNSLDKAIIEVDFYLALPVNKKL